MLLKRSVMGKMIEFTRPDGASAPGYFTEPAHTADAPGIVLLEEWWGVNEQIIDTAERLSSAGFRVLIPDLFRGRVAGTNDEASHLMEGLDFADAAMQDAPGAAAYLRAAGSRKTGIMGFCMGGAVVLLSAMHMHIYDAVVAWYGLPPEEAGDPGSIAAPLQMHWALDDAFFPMSTVERLEERLHAGNVAFESHRYAAKHAFHNPKGLGNYDPEHAERAWERSVAFFKKHLG